ncbi:MAG: flavodoxin family protein, partial [Bauldia sp.]
MGNLAAMASPKIHVASYSLTGNTRKAAEALLGLLDGDATSEAIVPVRPPELAFRRT